MVQNPLYVLAALSSLIFLSEWLCRHTFLRHLSSALLVIILGAIAANLGLIPTASNASPVYGIIFNHVAPASIFFLLLGVNLKEIRRAGGPMLLAFGLGALGTMLGVWLALHVIDYRAVFGANYPAIAGMMTGTYIGGSANFNAIALHYGVMTDGAIYTGMMVSDNIISAVWMLVTLLLPSVMNKIRPHAVSLSQAPEVVPEKDNRESVNPSNIAALLGLCVFSLLISDQLAAISASAGVKVPAVLILTTISLLLAQSERIKNLSGANLLGMFSVYLFLVVVGAFSELNALVSVGERAVDLLLFTTAIVVFHGVFLIGTALLLKTDWAIVAIASQANIGGASTALALARTFERKDLLLPAILVGTLGTGVGTYLGFLVAGLI